ncbi:MAG TPA: hypothetical protein DCS19_04120 [Flavobacterium sp.]|nr:hypothetical protein [Flavobacterium sp.]
MPLNYPMAPNSLRLALNQNYRRRTSGSSVLPTSQGDGVAIVYGEAISAGQLITIVGDKAYKPSVIASNNRPVIGIALTSGNEDTVGRYATTGEYVTPETIGTGILFASSVSPYYSLTLSEANDNICQIIGRQLSPTRMILSVEESENIEV